MSKSILLLFVLFLLGGCAVSYSDAAPQPTAFANNPASYEGKTVTVSGHVRTIMPISSGYYLFVDPVGADLSTQQFIVATPKLLGAKTDSLITVQGRVSLLKTTQSTRAVVQADILDVF